MLLYGAEQPTKFAPSFAEAVAADNERSAAASDLFEAQRALQLYRDNSNAEKTAMIEAYDRRNQAVFEATGVQLENPLIGNSGPNLNQLDSSLPFPEAKITQGALVDGKIVNSRYRDPYKERLWLFRLQQLAREHPDQAAVLAPDRQIEDDAFALARGAEAAAAAAAARADAAGVSGFRSTINDIGGAFAGMLRDPLQVATLFAGGGTSATARTMFGRVLQTAATEAAINAGVEATVQAASQDWKRRAGLDGSFANSLTQVGLAALFGGAFGGLAEGIGSVIAALGRAPPKAVLERLAAGTPQPGDAGKIAEALGGADPAAVRAAEMAVEQPALDAAAFGPAPAGISDADAEKLAAAAIRAVEEDDAARFIQIDRIVSSRPLPQRPRRPQSLMQFLASPRVGGIVDEGGELAAMGLTGRFVPGAGGMTRARAMPDGSTRGARFDRRLGQPLLRPDGKSLDYAREAAAEAGYFDQIYGSPERALAESTPADLLRLLRDEAGGTRAYSSRDGGQLAEIDFYEQSVKARETYRNLLAEVDSARAALDLPAVPDTVMVRAAELAEAGDDATGALERALDEDYRLHADAAGEEQFDDADLPFFDGQDARAVPDAGRAAGDAGADRGARPGRDAEAAGEQLPGAGRDEGQADQLAPAGRSPEPGTPEAEELSALTLTEAGGARAAPDDKAAKPGIYDALPAGRDAEGALVSVTHADMIEDAERSAFYADLVKSCRD